MQKQLGQTAALPGSLDREILSDLVVYREFLDDRDRAMLGLYGKRLPRSQLRDTLVRAVLIEFGAGQARNVSFYQRGLAYIGSSSAVRTEIARLVSFGLLIMAEAGTDRRSAHVLPTEKLVNWYSENMPRLYDQIRRFLAVREGLSVAPAISAALRPAAQ